MSEEEQRKRTDRLHALCVTHDKYKANWQKNENKMKNIIITYSDKTPQSILGPHNAWTYNIYMLEEKEKRKTPYVKKCKTPQQNKKKITTPPQNIHLSCFARRSIVRIVSPLTPSVFATLYNRRCVPLSISRCWPRSPSTARPRSRNSSSCELVLEKKDCSRRAWFSRV